MKPWPEELKEMIREQAEFGRWFAGPMGNEVRRPTGFGVTSQQEDRIGAEEQEDCPTCGGCGHILNDCLALTHPEYEPCPTCEAEEQEDER